MLKFINQHFLISLFITIILAVALGIIIAQVFVMFFLH